VLSAFFKMQGERPMPILQINFKVNAAPADYRAVCESISQAIANVPGLLWKVWVLNEAEKEAGGIYLFKDERSLDNYFSGPIAAQIKSHPALSDLIAKRFDVMKGVTAITHGPIPATVPA
jgi:Putative mono-oxygenase ydhR